jgi:hypothetical protein
LLLASSTAKKVIVRRFDRESVSGFVNQFSYLQPQAIELLRPDGAIALLPYREVRSVAFVKDFEEGSDQRRVFLTRPKLEGLWVRMVFRDGEVMDGILPNNLLAWEAAGFTVTPPEPDGNHQKVFVPREALRSIQILGVVGSPLRVKRAKPAPTSDQPSLF